MSAFPKKTSKILAGIKPEEEVGPSRAKKFIKKCEQIEQLRDQRRRYGNLTEKNLSKLQLCFGDLAVLVSSS